MTKPLKTRYKLLRIINRFRQANGYAPSIRELVGLMGYKTTSAAHYQMEHLEREGLITWRRGQSRTIALTAKGEEIANK